MRKYFLIVLIAFYSITTISQTRGVKIGYIDMEYILEKVPAYAEANAQLEQKAQKWKQEIEEKKNEIKTLKETLKSEKVLLTKELLEEREEEITFLESELSDYQQKRFGPNGDLMTQKSILVKPIQDQVFNAVQDIAEAKNYDYILDRSSDLTMLFAKKNLDISDRVVTILMRAERKEQQTKKQLKAEEEADKKQDMINDNPELVEKQKALEDKRAERIRLLEERKLAAEEKRKAFEDKRKQMLEDKKNKNGTVSDKQENDGKPEASKTSTDKTSSEKSEEDKLADEQKAADALAARNKIQEDRKKALEDRKKALEEKRLKALADREAAKKAKEDEKNKK